MMICLIIIVSFVTPYEVGFCLKREDPLIEHWITKAPLWHTGRLSEDSVSNQLVSSEFERFSMSGEGDVPTTTTNDKLNGGMSTICSRHVVKLVSFRRRLVVHRVEACLEGVNVVFCVDVFLQLFISAPSPINHRWVRMPNRIIKNYLRGSRCDAAPL